MEIENLTKKQMALNTVLKKLGMFASTGHSLIENFEVDALVELSIDLEVMKRLKKEKEKK